MKNKTKYWMGLIGILGVLLGRILNRVLSRYFGNNASNIVVEMSVTIILCIILTLIIMGYKNSAIILFIMVIPLGIGGIGLYLNNMDIVGLGILLIFIIYPILLKVIPKLKHDK